jgi:di/tricarboxylate transporter
MTDVFSSLTGLMGALGDWATVPATPDDQSGVLMPVVAGAAAALAVATVTAIYFRSGYRSSRDILRHGVATIVLLGLLAFVAYDMRHTALDYLGINPSKPAVEFEIHRSRATALAGIASETPAGLHTG